MQVFITGSPLETAMALDSKRLNKQIVECGQILDALDGKKAWRNHPCTFQYECHRDWLKLYQWCLFNVQMSLQKDMTEEGHKYYLKRASLMNDWAMDCTPQFHKQEYFDQMKRRLYSKDNVYYKQWAELGESDINWYWSDKENKFIKYRNGKRID